MIGIVRLSEPLELIDSAKVIAIEQIIMAIIVFKISKLIKIKSESNVIKTRVAVNIITEPSIDFISSAILYLCVSFFLLPTNEAKGSATAKIIYDSAVDRKSEFSGVDLDTEAARLLEQQQAYQALAKVLSTAKEMIDTLLRFM